MMRALLCSVLLGCGSTPVPPPRTTPIPVVRADPRAGEPDPVALAFARVAETRRVEIVRWPVEASRVSPTDAQVAAWVAAHPEEAHALFVREQHRFRGLELQVRARHILVKVRDQATPDERQAARTKILDAQRRIRAGEDFAAVAIELSEDNTARRGGDLGWNPRGRMVEPFETEMFRTQPGRVSPIVETRYGLHLIRVEGRRQGDVPEADAVRELAVPVVERELAVAAALEAAREALRRRREGLTAAALDAELHAACTTARQPNGPRVRRTIAFRRGDPDRAIGAAMAAGSTVITEAAFAATLEEPFAPEPFVLDDAVVVMWLTDVEAPNPRALTAAVRDCLEATPVSDCVPRGEAEWAPGRPVLGWSFCQDP